MTATRISEQQDTHRPALGPAVLAPAAGQVHRDRVRVLVLVASRSVEAGPIKGCFQLITGLRSPELEFLMVNFCTGPDDPKRVMFTEAAAAAGVPIDFVTQCGRSYLGVLRQLDAIVQREEIDIVQSHGFKPAVMCAWLRLVRRLPWVCFRHGATRENWRVRIYNAIGDLTRLLADRTVFVSRAQCRGLLGRLRRARIRVIHNAVDMSRPAAVSPAGPAAVRRMLGLQERDRLAVAVGRLSPEKGLDVLVDAVGLLQADPPGGRLHLALVGEGPERERLTERVRRLHLASRVCFVGHTNTPGDYLLAADLVVLPSRSEGIPNVALEAMALGQPLVATAVGGTPEVVPAGVAGLLVPSGDPAALAAAIHRVLVEPGLADALAAGGRAHAARELSVTTRCNRLRAVYTELMPRLSAVTRERPA